MAIDKAFLPGPVLSFKALIDGCINGAILKHMMISGYRVLLAICASFILAAPIGIVLGQNEKLDNFFSPMVHFLYPIPKVVLLPVIVVLFGLGDFPKIFLIALVLFFQLLVVSRDAAKQIPADYLLLAKSLCITGWGLWKNIFIPSCLPYMITSIRVGIGSSIAILFFAESFASVTGLGYYISDAMSKRSYEDMYAGILAMAILGLIFYALIRIAERKTLKWQH